MATDTAFTAMAAGHGLTPMAVGSVAVRCFALALLGLASAAGAAIPCMNRHDDALPATAQHVAPEQWREVQELLDRHGSIRLTPGADYRKATGVRLHSHQRIYGAAGTRIGRIVVVPGTEGAILSGVIPESLEFPPSDLATRHNCFERFGSRHWPQAPLVLSGAVVRENLFLDTERILIDTSRTGAVVGNRFIRTLVHGHSPVIRVYGAPGRSSDRNTFLWINALGPEGDAIQVRNQREVNFVAFDAEGWNTRRLARDPAMLTVADSGTIRAFLAHGGDAGAAPGRFMDIDADQFLLAGLRLFRAGTPAIRIAPTVRFQMELMSGNAGFRRDGGNGFSLTAFRDATSAVMLEGIYAGNDDMQVRVPWEAPTFPPVPDPAGSRWQQRRTDARDDAAAIQALIDRDGLVQLPPGVFHVGTALRLKDGQGLIGAGAGRTAIVAKHSGVDIIVGADLHADKHRSAFALVDITLQGGRAGIRHDAAGAGAGAQFNLIHLSHVVFRDMAQAGIVVDGIYGWDNNLLGDLTFMNMPTGILQLPNPRYADTVRSGDIAGMNYMDKNVCYRCRFVGVDTGMRLEAKRPNGLNACINCRFESLRGPALDLVNNLSTLVANSHFSGSGAAPLIRSNLPVGVVASRFRVEAAGTVFDADVLCESCEITAAGGAAVAGAARRRLILHNSVVRGVGTGAAAEVLVIDSDLGKALPPARIGLWRDGRFTSLVPGQPRPVPALLVDWVEQ